MWNKVDDIYIPGIIDTCLAVWENRQHGIRMVCETIYHLDGRWKAIGRRLHEFDEWKVAHWMKKPEPPYKNS